MTDGLAARRLTADGPHLRDEDGRIRVLHGINLAAKGRAGARSPEEFRGAWTDADLERLAAIGLDSVRLAVIWAAVEPEPGRYSDEHLAWLGEQLDRLHRAGLAVILDAHQDLFSQEFGDGAPAWATLTEQPFEPGELWSDAYLSSAAVQEAYDAFWADAAGPGGVGIQERFARMWGMLAARWGDHPAVIGYDVLNEPVPGRLAGDALGALLAALADATGHDAGELATALEDAAGKESVLALLDDPAVHRTVGDAVAPLLERFERVDVGGLYERVVPRIRAHDRRGLVLREHDYFGNLGVPVPVAGVDDAAWAYSPHAYDLVVDTAAMVRASDRRITTILERIAETARRLGVPVVVGEWGGFDARTGIGGHADLQLDLFDRLGWSWFYWCWLPGFAATEGAARLRRPRPVAVAGRDLRCDRGDEGWEARWTGAQGRAPTLFWVPPEHDVTLELDGGAQPVVRRGPLVEVAPRPGSFRLSVR